MSADKYAIEQFEYRTDSVAVVESLTNAIICESTCIDDARIICKLLNENENRKIAWKIDNRIKELEEKVDYWKDYAEQLHKTLVNK